MGYRSDVHGIIYGTNDSLAPLVAEANHKGIWTKLHDMLEVTKIKSGGIVYDAILLRHEGIKWYETYPEVKAWEELRQLAQQRDTPEHPIHFEFIRVGEEVEDVEFVSSEDNYELLWLKRNVEAEYETIEEGEEVNG